MEAECLKFYIKLQILRFRDIVSTKELSELILFQSLNDEIIVPADVPLSRPR